VSDKASRELRQSWPWGWGGVGEDGSGWLSEFGGGAALVVAVEVVVEALVPLRPPGELEEGGGGEAEEVS